MEELVSIITPLYNASSTIEETIKSVQTQLYHNWEMIIVDDCSTDDSASIVENLSKSDHRIILIKKNNNGGTAEARNIAIKKARGRYIAFLDADDLWKPEKLKTQIAFMENNRYPFSYSNYDVLKNKGKVIAFAPKKESLSYSDLLLRNDIGCLTVVYDVLKVGKIYMPYDAPKREDYAAWLDFTKRGFKAYKINESLAIYRLGKSSLTSNKKRIIKYHYRVYRCREGFGIIKSLFYLFLFTIIKLSNKYV